MHRVIRRLLQPACLLLCVAASNSPSHASLIAIELDVTDLYDNRITDAVIGDEFWLQAFVTDSRNQPEGVFAAWLDVTYTSTVSLPTGPLQYGLNFVNALSGDTSMPGLIDEAGAFTDNFRGPAIPADRQLLWQMPFTTIAVGRLDFVSNPSDLLPFHESLLFGLNDVVDPDDIHYGTASLNVHNAVPEPRHIVLVMLTLGWIVAAIGAWRGRSHPRHLPSPTLRASISQRMVY